MKTIECKDFKKNDDLLMNILLSIKCNEFSFCNAVPSRIYLPTMTALYLIHSNYLSMILAAIKEDRPTFYNLKKQILSCTDQFIESTFKILNSESKEQVK